MAELEASALAEPQGLENVEMERYTRQMLLPELGGIQGQIKLRQTRVLIVGAGGLGSPAALYLAAAGSTLENAKQLTVLDAGIGTIGIVDADRVELSNLHRQVIHAEGTVGAFKTESARAGILRINSRIQCNSHQCRLSAANAVQMVCGQ